MTSMGPGIGIVGAGLIVEHAHLPAYRDAGFRVVGITDANPARAADLARRFGLEALPSVNALLDDGRIDIIDCAITPSAQRAVLEQAFDSGRHVLAQKPLADSLEEARALVDRADRAGVVLAVNQQMRWDPTVQAMKQGLASGVIGRPVLLRYRLNFMGEYPGPHWVNDLDRLFARFGTIHYVDSARYLFGEPNRVTARLLKDPEQHAKGETFINVWLEWPDGTVMVGFERYTSKTGDVEAILQLDGTQGAIRGDLGLYHDYPHPNPDRVERIDYAVGEWTVVSESDTWLPGAFAEPMRSLIRAIETDERPATDARDNLRTLEVIEAMYESDRTGRSVTLEGT